jgi:uncharacterized protein YbdZ (MbtH family)
MKLVRMLALTILVMMSLFTPSMPTVEAAPASAPAPAPVAQQSSICSNQAIPGGWAVVQAYAYGSCHPYLNYIIRSITGPMWICGVALHQTIPAGWAVTTSTTNYTACTNIEQMYIQPVTQAMWICGVNLHQTIPFNWAVTTSTSNPTACNNFARMYIQPVTSAMWICGVNMDRSIPQSYVVTVAQIGSYCSNFQTLYIQPTSGTSMNVCAAKGPPPGWYVAANYGSGGNCGSFVNQWIRKY